MQVRNISDYRKTVCMQNKQQKEGSTSDYKTFRVHYVYINYIKSQMVSVCIV